MLCPNTRCERAIPDDAALCCYCGRKLSRAPSRRTRPNGAGTAYKRGSTWTACVVVGWKTDEEKKIIPVKRTRGGFATKKAALDYCPTLKASAITPKKQAIRAESSTFISIFNAVILRLVERGRSRSTTNCYNAAMNYFKPLHNIDIRIIGVDDLQECMSDCPRGKRTKENMKAITGLIYKYAMERDIVAKNLAEFLFTGNEAKGTRPPFTFDEVDLIKNNIGIVPYADYVYFMIYSGYRPAELLSYQKSQYDAKNVCIWGGVKTDAGKDRAVTISPKILPVLRQRLLTPYDYLFPRLDTGESMSVNYFRDRCFNPCMEALGIKDRVPYSARHAFANLLKLVSGSDTDKAALMGHSDASMTKQYQSADLESVRKITNAI